MTDPKAFKTGREFAAWIGLVPRQNSTGGKERLGSISKQGDPLPAATIGHQCNIHCQDRAHAAGQASLGDRTAGSSAYQGGRRGRWPTRWRGSPGLCWPRVRLIGHRPAQATQPPQRRLEGLGIEIVCEAAQRRTGTSRVMSLMRTDWTRDRENPLLGHALSSAGD